MDDVRDLEQLRDLFLSAPETAASRVVGIVVALSVAGLVLYLVRKRALREEYTPIWMAVAAAMLLISVHSGVLKAITRALGAWTASSTLFFLGEVFLLAICLNFAVRLSRASAQMKVLGQEVALLRERLDALPGRDGDEALRSGRGAGGG